MRLCNLNIPANLSIVFHLQRRNGKFLTELLFEVRKPCFTFRGRLEDGQLPRLHPPEAILRLANQGEPLVVHVSESSSSCHQVGPILG